MNTNYINKLVNEPVVEMILSQNFKNIRFEKSLLQKTFICYFDGVKKKIFITRNPAKYYKSNKFNLYINKNNLSIFNCSTFAFIDEVSDSLYLIDGIVLLKYIIDNSDKLVESNNNTFTLLADKSDICLLAGERGRVLKYNKDIANYLLLNK